MIFCFSLLLFNFIYGLFKVYIYIYFVKYSGKGKPKLCNKRNWEKGEVSRLKEKLEHNNPSASLSGDFLVLTCLIKDKKKVFTNLYGTTK